MGEGPLRSTFDRQSNDPEADKRVLPKGQRKVAASIFGRVAEGSRKETTQNRVDKGKSSVAVAKEQGGNTNNRISLEEEGERGAFNYWTMGLTSHYSLMEKMESRLFIAAQRSLGRAKSGWGENRRVEQRQRKRQSG